MHRIRLRGAWRIERRDDGSAVFERSFGSPRTLDDGETVWLVCDAVPGNGEVLVNGVKVGDVVVGIAFEADVTVVMRVRNSVRFDLDGVGDAELGEVGLEFRAYQSSCRDQSQIESALESIADRADFGIESAALISDWTPAALGLQGVVQILRFMEQHPLLDYGTPGAIVHFLEHFHLNGYEEKLVESIRRLPTPHTVWMLNRLINGTPDRSTFENYLCELRQVAINNKADQRTREIALGYLESLTHSPA